MFDDGSRRPELKARSQNIYISTRPDKRSESVVFFQIQIYNSGSRSIAKDWALTVTGADKNEYHGVLIVTLSPPPNYGSDPVPIVLVPISSPQGKLLGEADYLVQRASLPIESGAMLDGWIAFTLPDVSNEYLRENGTKFEITFSDVADKRCSVPPLIVPAVSAGTQIDNKTKPPSSTH
jgi:uncharacterized protein affecting Mg2+/Co2+ transport